MTQTMQEKLQEIANKATKTMENPSKPVEMITAKKYIGNSRRGLQYKDGFVRPDLNLIFPDPINEEMQKFYDYHVKAGNIRLEEVAVPVPETKE